MKPDQWEQGSIVLAKVQPPRGEAKVRPVLIITRRESSILDEEIVGVAITTTFPPDPPDNLVELPWDARGRIATGLRRRSAAVCDWFVRLRPSDIIEIRGFTPTKVLLDILQRIARRAHEPD